MSTDEEKFIEPESAPDVESTEPISPDVGTATGAETAGAETSEKVQDSLFIVGIGASAGGLTALQQFFDQMPADSGMVFVIVTHLAPEHDSHLPRLLQMHTSLPVTEVSKTTQMLANHVYVIPPNRYLSAIDTHLRVSHGERGERPRSPIDHFFRTLADMHSEHAIGVILSGTGSDGAVGIKRIKERGGLTIAQDPGEAEYDGMPQSAIATGVVDFVLLVSEMPLRLQQYAASSPQVPVKDDEPAPDGSQEIIQRILTQLRGHTGHDFSRYRPTTIIRRIRRRMQIQQVEALSDYLQLLRSNRGEVQALFKDVLITVTNFFRDKEAFDFLEEEVIPALFRDKAVGDQVRVWVIGCATGEEAYSIAMLLLEYAGQVDYPPAIQIFASDISEEALARAREGLYSEAINADVSSERLERFFHREPGGYRVKKEVRECILFAPHNLLKDPPFSRLDLISCRNLLIYFRRDAQRQVYELMHYALKSEGYLFLGPAETIEGMEFFREVSKKYSVYQGVSTTQSRLPLMPLTLPGRTGRLTAMPEHKEMTGSAAIYRLMLDRYASPSILVNADYNIIHLSELAGRYLQQPGGEPTNNILRRILAPLRVELTTFLYRAFQNGQVETTKPVQVAVGGDVQTISLRIYPATEPDLKGFALIVFDEVEKVEEDGEPRQTAEIGDTTVHKLENELEQTRQRLQTTIEEFETSKEEMKAANEELLSMNEELRSTAEELETSKEELQSMNEELLTLNQENKNKVEELSQMTGDLQNLLMATGIATLFLDRELRIKRFTPRVGELFNILVSDRGRPLAHLTHKLGYENVLVDAATVLRTLIPIEREMQSKDGHWFLTRFLPYRTIDDRIDGVVITFVDINDQTYTRQELQRRERQQAVIAALSRLALGGAEQDVLFEQATRQICETLGIQFCEVLNFEADKETLHFKAGYGWDKKLIGQAMSPTKPKSPALYNLETKEPVLVEEWTQEIRFQPPDYVAEQSVVSSVSVVIPGLQHPYGVLRAHTIEKRSFSSDEVEFFQAVAHLLAEAIERKEFEGRLRSLNETLEQRVEQRTEQVRTLASELIVTEQRVRQRISQVLHADLQQLIFAAQMNLKLMEQALSPEEHANTLAELQQTRNMVDEALRLSRQLTLDLSPPVLQGQDLGEALQWLVTHMRELHKLNVELQLQEIPESPGEDMPLLLFQIVRELLFNVVKHAGVNEAQVKVFSEDSKLVVQVIDEGAGFDVPAILAEPPHDGGYGLLNMGERLGLFGSQMTVRSEPGIGTTVTVTVPRGADEPPEG